MSANPTVEPKPWTFYIFRLVNGTFLCGVTESWRRTLAETRTKHGVATFEILWRQPYASKSRALWAATRFNEKSLAQKVSHLALLSGVQLVQVRRPPSSATGCILFVHGYSVDREKRDKTHLPDWVKPLLAFARERDLGLYLLCWESGRGIIHILSEYLSGNNHFVITAQHADLIASKSPLWLAGFRGPVHLVGHSLGARLILRALSKLGKHRIASLLALAPAMNRAKVSINAASREASKKGIICYSNEDWILKRLYRLGTAIGLSGIEGYGSIQALDVTSFDGEEVGHTNYPRILPKLLRKTIRTKRKPQSRIP